MFLTCTCSGQGNMAGERFAVQKMEVLPFKHSINSTRLTAKKPLGVGQVCLQGRIISITHKPTMNHSFIDLSTMYQSSLTIHQPQCIVTSRHLLSIAAWKRLMALSFGTQRQQLEHRTIAVCPRPCLERPLFRRLDGIVSSLRHNGTVYLSLRAAECSCKISFQCQGKISDTEQSSSFQRPWSLM